MWTDEQNTPHSICRPIRSKGIRHAFLAQVENTGVKRVNPQGLDHQLNLGLRPEADAFRTRCRVDQPPHPNASDEAKHDSLRSCDTGVKSGLQKGPAKIQTGRGKGMQTMHKVGAKQRMRPRSTWGKTDALTHFGPFVQVTTYATRHSASKDHVQTKDAKPNGMKVEYAQGKRN